MAKANILLVEDDQLQAKVTKNYLEAMGYDVIWVDDGKAAIKVAKTQSVELILLDLVLPDIDGNEVCRWLKVNQDTRSIPIIMLTVKGATTDKVTGLEAGANDYLQKPYSETELNARIYACLRTKALQDELREKNKELESALLKLEFLAITDPLTELFNRRHFEAAIENEFVRTLRYQSPTSCIMIDIDHFKRINDQYGHRAGDMVLKEIARLIKCCIREIDTAARWGGEEFSVLLPQTTQDAAVNVAQRTSRSVSDYAFTSFTEKITVSIGIATVPEKTIDTAEKLIHASDLALYKAKANGRNRVECFLPEET
jgi:diguanylate cyclase (GGDEF)-like protein